ncbi:MAG: hypothetical protein OXB98_15050 [Bryobacterales bacterium]|nr:hypothetical protein [Bryobacterales bacterium]
MANFRFDEGKNFAQNYEAFLDAIEADDPEMTAILRENWDSLVAVVRAGERDSKARGEFNTKVASALDAHLAKLADAKGGA